MDFEISEVDYAVVQAMNWNWLETDWEDLCSFKSGICDAVF